MTTLLDYSISKMRTQKMNLKIPRPLLRTTLTGSSDAITHQDWDDLSLDFHHHMYEYDPLSSFDLTLLDIIHCSTPLRLSITSWNSSLTNTSFACSDFLTTVLVQTCPLSWHLCRCPSEVTPYAR
eukprot:scaffold18109_cov54-Attheya_sp.AAC.8